MNLKKAITFILVTVVLALSGNLSVHAQVIQKLSGVTDSIDSQNKKIRILFEHPVTGEQTIKEFDIFSSTGFKNVKRLDQIKPEDPISIDYEESETGTLKAIYIEVVSLKKVPFTREEVRKKIRLPL